MQSETGKKAFDLYENRIREKVEAGNIGRYIVIDVNSGDYEIGDSYLAPTDRLMSRHADANLYAFRIGHPVGGRIGGRVRPVTA